MPNPIVPDFYRAQVIFEGKTGLPEDVFVNTFVFKNLMDASPATPPEVADKILARLQTFYDEPVSQTGQPVCAFFTSQLVKHDVRVKVYDLGETPPRPVHERQFTLTGMPNAGALPPEVACVASFYGQKLGQGTPRNLPRQRGRVYLGPLAAQSLESRGGSLYFRSDMRVTIAHAMRRMTQDNLTKGVGWSTLSTTYSDTSLVQAGWVDDAPDIQRRRGVKASQRTLWTVDGVVTPQS